MKIHILTHEKTIYEGQAISLQINCIDGSFQLLDHHYSIIALLKEVNIHLNQEKSIFYINNGMLEVKNGIVNILVIP